MKNPFDEPIVTFCNIKGVEFDVSAEVDQWPEDNRLAVTAVWLEDQGDMLEQMSSEEKAELEQPLLDGIEPYERY